MKIEENASQLVPHTKTRNNRDHEFWNLEMQGFPVLRNFYERNAYHSNSVSVINVSSSKKSFSKLGHSSDSSIILRIWCNVCLTGYWKMSCNYHLEVGNLFLDDYIYIRGFTKFGIKVTWSLQFLGYILSFPGSALTAVSAKLGKIV